MDDQLQTPADGATVPVLFDAIKVRAQTFAELAGAHRITDDISRQVAAEMRSQIKVALGQAEGYRVLHVKPLNVEVKRINDRVRPIREQLEGAVETIDREVTRDHGEREERARVAREEAARLERQAQQEAEEKARKEREEEAERARKETQDQATAMGYDQEDAGELASEAAQAVADKCIPAVEPPVVVVPTVVAPQRTVRSASGASITVSKVLDFRVVDLVTLADTLPGAIEVKRNAVLAYGRSLEAQGKSIDGQTIAGVKFFRRSGVSGR